ncbi:bifunctional phosphoribosylaminoimidazolecarboxamide formyltransferase/IMP cyclohydrolase [Streptococcus pyogenes]
MTKRALISVSDKSGIVDFAKELKNLGWDIISTGGTKVALDNAGVETIAIDDVTGFPEMMDGRVKTLHPNIHGGLLARRDADSHLQAAKDNNIELIDLVVVNLYPFKETILRPDITYDLAVENIDIGGPSMLRSAAKNHASVTVVVDPADYATVLGELADAGQTTFETRQRLAAKVFRHTAAYDALIAEYFTTQVGEAKPEKLTITYDLKQAMRYGENPQQDADFYQKSLPTDYSIASAKQLNGKELSFNNIRDADAAIRIIRDFKDRPTVVVLKHMNPCGIGQADDIETAWDYAYEADPVSIFGGIVVLNREVDAATAKKMHPIFLEIIIAPSYSEEALAILTNKKKNLRILELLFDAQAASEVEAEYTGVVGGLLVQNQDVVAENPSDWQVVTDRQPTEQEATALEFAWKAIKYVKSNGIIITNDHMTLGLGAGQTNRVGSVKIAIEQAKDHLDGAVLASDAFFPFADNIEEIAAAGIKAIIQPGGSVRDQDSIDAANKHGLTMIFTGVRHFRH